MKTLVSHLRPDFIGFSTARMCCNGAFKSSRSKDDLSATRLGSFDIRKQFALWATPAPLLVALKVAD